MTPPERPGAPGDPTPRTPRPEFNTGQYAGLGMQLAASAALFAFLGVWLDRKLGTAPWLTILFVFVGAGAGIYSIYRKVFPPPRRDPRDASRRSDEGTP